MSSTKTAGVSDMIPSNRFLKLFLRAGLLLIILFVFVFDAVFGLDWEVLTTKHYWAADIWYYGGYANQYVETPKGNRTLQQEGLTNYSNLFALQETLPPAQRRHQVDGFPATERLASTFLIYLLLHLTGKSVSIWSIFWTANVLLWLVSIFLAYKLALFYFADDFAPLFAAYLVALYPALTLTFLAIKQQPLGTVFFLAGIYLFEKYLNPAGFLLRTAALAAILFLGLFSVGGWLFLAIYILLRACWLPRPRRPGILISLIVAVLIAKIWLACLGHLYRLPSVTRSLDLNVPILLKESWTWTTTWILGRDVSGMKFLGYPGKGFFLEFIPLLLRAFIELHAPLLLTTLVGLFFLPQARMFLLISLTLFVVGHSGTLISGWTYHYGYLSFPAAMMLIFSASGVLGYFATNRALLLRIFAIAILAFSCWNFTDQKRQAGIYYGGFAERYQRGLLIHYPDEPEPIRY